MRLIILLLTAFWYESPSNNGRVLAQEEDERVIPKRFSRLWKRQDDLGGYLEQCSILQFWDKQIGRVNVLAFFDSSWQFSHRQAAMLRVLRERFGKTGFDNIQFFAINAVPGEAQYIDRTEIQVEEETWKQISPSEAEGLPPVVVSTEALIEALGPDVYFVQDNRDLQIWPKLRAFRDQILVIDRCGRLTYQVIVPWSILHFPYVKAAILSTYKDDPCGYCQFQEPSFDTVTTENSNTPSPSEESSTLNIETETNSEITSDEPPTTNYQYENTDIPPFSEESSMYNNYQTDYKYSQSATEEPSTIIAETESTTNFDTTTNAYNPSTMDLRDDAVANVTNNEYADDFSNYTTTINTESTTEQVQAFIIRVVDTVDADNNTEQPISEVEPPTTTEISNTSINTEETRLKDASEIESLDARDVLKSRSTNARSVSPNDGTENNLEFVEINGETSSERNILESDYLLPLRIIMRAPHVDEYSDRTMKAHEYLVLKTGLPEYHGHLESREELESKMDEEKHTPIRKKSEAIRRSFGKDESPGLYGEVADYWRNFGNEQTLENTQTSIDDDEALDEETSYTDDDITLRPTTLSFDRGRENTENPYEKPALVPIEQIELDNEKLYGPNSEFNEELDVVDEEAKSKLIAHYSKLLPWLYYVLAK